MASSMITAAAAAAATASASSAATGDELKGVEEDDGRRDGEVDEEDGVLNSSSSRSCANDPEFAVICVFLHKFHKDLGVAKPNFKQLQEWLTNTDDVSEQLRLLHIKLLRKTRKIVHEKSWESSLSKFCFTYSAQDAWEIERFGYKKSSLKVKLRILRELLESQFQRNAKFRAQILTMSADSLRSQPIGRDRLGHTYYFTQDDDANLRIYQEHLDEDIWQVVATTREELVNLISRLRGNEVVMPSTDIGVDEDTSSSNSGTAQLEKPPPPVEQDDSQEEEARVPNLRIKFTSNNGKVTVSSPTLTTASIATKRNLDEINKSSPRSEELHIIKKARPSLLDANRAKKPSRYEKSKSEDEEGEEDDDDEEDDEEELSIEEEDIDSAAAEEDENEEKDIEEDSGSDVDGDNEIGESIEEPPLVIRGEGSGKDCDGGNMNMIFSCNAQLFDEDVQSETETDFYGQTVEEETLYVYGEGSGAECLVGNGKNDDSKTATTAAKVATPTPSTPTKTGDNTATFFFGEPGCLKLSPIKPTPLADKEKGKYDDVQSKTTDNKEKNTKIDEALPSKKMQATVEGDIKEKGSNANSQEENSENLKAADVKNISTDELTAPVPNENDVKVTSNGEYPDCCTKKLQVTDEEPENDDTHKETSDKETKRIEKLKERGGFEVNEKLEKPIPEKLEESMETVAVAKLPEGEENVIFEKIEKSEGNALNEAGEKSKAVETTNVQRMEKGQESETGPNLETRIKTIGGEVVETDDEIAADEKLKNSQKKTVEAKDKKIEKATDEQLEKVNKEIAEDINKVISESVISEKLENSLENVATKKLEKSTKNASNPKVSEVNVEDKDAFIVASSSSKDEFTEQKMQLNEEEINIVEKEDKVQSEENTSCLQKNDTLDNKHVAENKIDDETHEAKEVKNEDKKTCIIGVPGRKNQHKAKESESNTEKNVEENIVGNDKVDEIEISQISKTDESENGVEETKQQQNQKKLQQKDQKQQKQEINQTVQKNPQKDPQQQEEKQQQKDQKLQPSQEETKLTEEEKKTAEQMPPIEIGDNSERKKLLIKSFVEEKFDSKNTKSSIIVSAQSIAKPSNSTSTSVSTPPSLSILPPAPNPIPTSISSSVSMPQFKSFPPCTSKPTTHSTVNRKRRLEDIPPPPTAQRLSTSESEVDLQPEQQEEFALSEDDLDPAGKRLKMRPKLTNIEVRKKVEAQKGCIEETTSSSGEEDARRRRKIIPQRRQIERCVKNLKVAQEAAAAKRESSLAQTVKEGENAVPLVEEKDAIPLNLTSPTTTLAFPPKFPAAPTGPPVQSSFVSTDKHPTAVVKMPPPASPASLSAVIPTALGSMPAAASTSKLGPALVPSSAPVPKVGPVVPTIRQKPTLAEIIEKKLKKTCEKLGATVLGETLKAPIALSTTAPVTLNSSTKDSNVIASFSAPKKSPITKPLKKNLLTQLRQEESDEESIPRKRTISDASAATPPTITITTTPTIKTEIVKKIESFFVEDRKEPERKRTPERKLAQPKTSDRKSADRKLPTRKMPERKTPDRRVAEHKSPEGKLAERKTPERKTPDRQRKRRSSEEVKIAGKIETESNKEMKYETLHEMETKLEKFVIKKEKSPSPVDTLVETEVTGRRSSRRSAASVVYAELPLPKRTRAGAKVTGITTCAASPAATPKKELDKQGKTSEIKFESSKVEDSVKAGDKRVATLTKETALTSSAKEGNTGSATKHVNATVIVKTKEISKENAKEAKKSKQSPKGTKATKKDSKKEEEQNEDNEPILKLELKQVSTTSVKCAKVDISHTKTTPNTPIPSAVKISPSSAKITADKNISDSTPTSSVRGRGMRSKLEVDATNILQTIDSETPVRQSRRIAQQKIREEAERRKLEEIALRTMKQELKKKKKAEKQSDPTVLEPSEPSSSDESEVELKKKAKKKYPGKDGWSSGSEEQEEPEEDDEPAQESDHGSPLFRSDHEFSPESELEDETLVVPMKRARTARKEDAEDGGEPDEHACQKCGKSDHPEWILLCDNCDKGYHCSCLSPVLFYIPEGDWYCPPCQQEHLIAALEKQLNDFDEFVEQKRVQEEENKRLAAEAERVAKERLENEMQQQKEDKERKKQLKKTKQRSENGKEDDGSGASASSDGAAGEEKSKKRAKESDDDSEDDKPLVRVKSAGNRKIRSESQRDSHRDSHKRHKRRRGDGGRRRRRAAARGIASRRRQRNTSDSGTGSGSHGTGSGSDGSSGSDSSSSSSSTSLSDSDDEPIYKLRKRRQINVSYRLNEYDDLINSALKKEMDAAAGAGNLGRGKDISTIIDADKEKTHQRQLEKDADVEENKVDTKAEKVDEAKGEQDNETKAEDDDKAKAEKVDQTNRKDEETKKKKDEETKVEKDKDTKAVKAQDSEVQTDTKTKQENNDDSDSSVEVSKRRAKPKPTAKKKKPRKLTTLDISSEEDNASDEDFKTSSFEDDEEDTSISASTASDSSLEIFRRRGKKNKKKRKAARRAVRQRRKDRRFVVNDSDDDEEEDRPKTKKKRKDDTDYTATDTDSEASENLEDVDSADLCDDTTSESDGAWYPSKRKKQGKANTSAVVARKSPKLKKQPVKKIKKVEYSDDDITESEEEEDDDDDLNGGKGSGKQPRSQPLIPSKSSKGKGKGKGKGKTSNSKKKKKKQSDDEDDSLSDSEDSTRRTRGRRYAYLEDFDDDSSDGGIKPGVQRPDTPPEERQKFIQRQEEIKRMLAEKNAEGAKLAATPRLTPIKADGDKEKRSPAKLSDSLSTVPLSVIRQAKVLDAEYLQRKGESIGGDLDHVDEVDEFDDTDLPDDFPEDMDEDTIARMVEEEEELSAAAAARELPPPDEVLRTPTKQASNKPKEAPLVPPAPSTLAAPPHIAAAVAAAAAVANLTASASAAAAASATSAQIPSHHINPSLAALAQMPGGVSTAAAAAAAAAAVHHMSSMSSGLQEPMRKRLPMPTMHPPLLRHQFPPHGTNMPLAHLLQRHSSAPPPPTHLLQNALNTPLGQPLNRNNFPPQHMPRLPAGMSMEQMLAAQHIMSAAAAARHNLPPTSQPLPSAPGPRDSIQNSSATGVGNGSGSSTGAVAAAIAAATAVAAASGANKPQSEPKPRGRRKKITPLRDTLQKQQTAAAVTAATTQSDKVNEAPSNNGVGSGVSGGGVIKSVVSATATAPPPPQLYKQQSGVPSVSSAPVSQASVITRMPQHSAAAAHASIARAMSNLYSGADVARFFAPPTSLASVTGPRPPHSIQRHRDSQGMPGLPHSAGMRQSYGPPPPLRGSAPNHGPPTHASAGDRQTYHAPGDHHMPTGMGASMYGGPPPPARHSTSHLNPYRPPIYGNPNFMPRGPGVPNLRVPGSGGPEFPGGPRSYAPYGYYPPPPPLTNPHAPPMQRHPPPSTAGPARGSAAPPTAPSSTPSTVSGGSNAAAHTSASASITTAANTKTNVTTTITAKPSSVIVSAPPSNAGASIHANLARNVVQKSPIPTPTITKTPTPQTATQSHMQTPPQTITPKATTSTPTSTSANSLSIPSRVIVTESVALSAPVAAIVNNNKGVVVTTTATPTTVLNEASQPPRKKLTTLETYAVTQTKSPLVMAGESSGSRSSPGGMQADAADDSSSAHGASSTAAPADSGEAQASEFSGLVSYFSSQHDDYNT